MRITASGNTLTLTINAQFTGNSVVSNIKKAMNTTGKSTEKVTKAINKASTNVKSFGGKIKTALTTATTSFNNLRGKVTRAFPLPPINGMIKKLKEMRQNSNAGGKGFDFLKGKLLSIGGAVAGIFAVGKAISFLKDSIQTASDMQETDNNFDVVFGNQAKAYDKHARDYSIKLGQSYLDTKTYMADVQNLFVGFGLDREFAAKMSFDSLQFANDLASFNNIEKSQAQYYMKKALMGESESAKMLGAVFNDAEMAKTMQSMNLKGNFKALDEATKIQVRYNTVLRQNQDAVGDVARNQGTYVMAVDRFNAVLEVLKTTIGGALLPIATEFIGVFGEGLSALIGDGSGLESLSKTLDGLKNSLKEMVNLPDVKKTFDSLKAGATSFGQSAGLGNIFGDMKTGAKNIFGDVMKVFSGLDFSSFGKNMGEGLNSLKSALGPAIDLLMTIFKSIDWNSVLQALGLLFNAVMKIVNVVVQVLVPPLKLLWAMIANNINSTIKSIKIILQVVIFVVDAIKAYFQGVLTFWSNVWEVAKSLVTSAFNYIVAFIQNPIGTIKATVSTIKTKVAEIVNGVKTTFQNGFNALIGIVQSAIDGVKNAIGGIVDKAREVVDAVKGFFKNGFKTEVTVEEKRVKAGEMWTGTKNWKGGLTWVAERGPELIKPPSGQPFVAQNKTLQNLPSGTQIFNAQDTRAYLKSKVEQSKEKFNNSRAGKMFSNVKETYNNITNKSSNTSNSTGSKKIEFKPNIKINITNNTDTNIQEEVRKVIGEVLEDFFMKLNILNGEVE